MSDLNIIDRLKIEKLLGMSGGYVLDFSNRTFQDFISNVSGFDIFSEKYENGSNSKANRLRAFLNIESNQVVGNLISNFCEYYIPFINSEEEDKLYRDCVKISEKLRGSIVEQIDSLKANSNDKDFNLLAKLVKESIEKNEPETGLDRLHTFVFKYVRELCDKHEILYVRDESLNSIFGKYVKKICSEKLIESIMAEKILKSSISILDAFNSVRNNQSYAHDNPILNYNESILIFNSISNLIAFVDKIENRDN